jgi:hypothetical protein
LLPHLRQHLKKSIEIINLFTVDVKFSLLIKILSTSREFIYIIIIIFIVNSRKIGKIIKGVLGKKGKNNIILLSYNFDRKI